MPANCLREWSQTMDSPSAFPRTAPGNGGWQQGISDRLQVRVRCESSAVTQTTPTMSAMDEDTKSEAGDAIPIFVSPIATPLAGKKLTKKCLKLVKKGACRGSAHQIPNGAHCPLSQSAASSSGAVSSVSLFLKHWRSWLLYTCSSSVASFFCCVSIVYLLFWLPFFLTASKNKAIRRGVKEVVKALRKNEKGYVTVIFSFHVENAHVLWRLWIFFPSGSNSYHTINFTACSQCFSAI
jgi:hypothetical protein